MMPRMSHAKPQKLFAVLVAVAIAAMLAGCGGSDQPANNETDAAFVEAMIPHHAIAVAAAQNQYQYGDSKELRNNARDLVNTQMAEITALDQIGKVVGAEYDQTYTAPLNRRNASVIRGDLDANTTGALEVLGLSAEEAGLSDRHTRVIDDEFVAMMIPHHEGAIRMARVQVEKGSNTELVRLARNIISKQSQEIEELKQIKP